MAEEGDWTWEDGWVLAAVIQAHGSEHPDWASVIGIADYINRVVLTREEIETAANRLRQARLVDPDDPLVPVGRAESLWERARGEGGPVASVRRLVALMNREVRRTENLPPWVLSAADHMGAESLYRRRFDEALRRLERRDRPTD